MVQGKGQAQFFIALKGMLFCHIFSGCFLLNLPFLLFEQTKAKQKINERKKERKNGRKTERKNGRKNEKRRGGGCPSTDKRKP